MLRHLGYVAIALASGATTNRTCRLRNATPERLRELIALNLDGLAAVLAYNLQQEIFLYRISSQLIPFGSHPINQLRWWEEFVEPLSEIGQFIRLHDMRVSMHPGQFTVLNSPNPAVAAAAIEDIRWQVRLLQALGTDASSKIVIHVGGAYGGKSEAIERFIETARSLPEEFRQRLIIENDERVFNAHEVLEVSNRTGLPVVFDWLHHRANPGTTENPTSLITSCFDTWGESDGLPKIHFSSQKLDGRLGQHDDWIDAMDFAGFLTIAPAMDFDCMLEAKQKDLALIKLRRDLSKLAGHSRP